MPDLRFGGYGLRFLVSGLGFGVKGLGPEFIVLEVRVHGSGLGVYNIAGLATCTEDTETEATYSVTSLIKKHPPP